MNYRFVCEDGQERVNFRASDQEWLDLFDDMIYSIRTNDDPPDRSMARSVLSQLAVAYERPIPDDIKAWLGQV